MRNKEEIVKVETVIENERSGEYKLYFMDELYCTYHCSKDDIEEIVDKRQRAYDLIPEGCKIIPKRHISQYNGKLVGGILEDSIVIVFGIANNDGIRGYSCSIYFIPSYEYFKSVIPDGAMYADDFESRTCKNCRYFNGQVGDMCRNTFWKTWVYGYGDECIPDPVIYPDSDFGCNKFERRGKEKIS